LIDSEPSSPFDAAAARYDDVFTRTVTGRLQRDQVWRVLDRVLPRSGRLVDFGCGTGEDVRWLAERGAERVVGLDASEAMLQVARGKADLAGVSEKAVFSTLDLAEIGIRPRPPDAPFDGALANFGVLNCLEDRRDFSAAACRWLKPGAPLVVVLMGPCCVWEISWHLLRLDPGSAFRRRRQGREVPLDRGGSVHVWYPGAAALRREFTPEFDHLETSGVGVFLPPPYLDAMVARRPRMLSLLAHLEHRLAHLQPFSSMADHTLLVFRNRGS
jgi:SAM-dependent methyltransferase